MIKHQGVLLTPVNPYNEFADHLALLLESAGATDHKTLYELICSFMEDRRNNASTG